MKFPEEVIYTLVNSAHTDQSGDNLYGECPYCGGDEFGISLEDNHLFRCFRGKECGETGNIFKLLKHLGKTELYKNKDFYKETDIFRPLEKRALIEGPKEVDMSLPDVSIPLGWRRMDSNPYLDSRGFSLSV